MKKVRLSETELKHLINRVVKSNINEQDEKDIPWWAPIVEVTPFAKVFKTLKLIEKKTENDAWTDEEIALAKSLATTVLPAKLSRALKGIIRLAKKTVDESDIRRVTKRVMNEWAPHTDLAAIDDSGMQVDDAHLAYAPTSTVTVSMINDCEHFLLGVPGGNANWIQTVKTMVMGKDCDWLGNKYSHYQQAMNSVTPGTTSWQRKKARLFFIECLWGKCLQS